jgi:anti-sigma regulatory factor (Ser/Thr protein kinase)
VFSANARKYGRICLFFPLKVQAVPADTGSLRWGNNMARLNSHALSSWITAAAVAHPHDLARHVAERTGVTRPTANKALQRLVEAQWLVRDGTPRRPHHRPGLLRQVVQHYDLQGLQEDLPWLRDFAPFFTLPTAVHRMVQHAFYELVNNAADHSGGSRVTVSLRQTPTQAQLLVSDNGRGVFDTIEEHFAIDDPTLAMLELSKGKLTTAPICHTGRGLFFTARMADVFDLHANGAAFQRREWEPLGWQPGRPLNHQGTSVYAAISLDTSRTIDSVLQAYSLDGEGVGFERTVVPLCLLASDQAELASRAQARRVAARLQSFRRVDVDFGGVSLIGHGFADELFRVQAGTLEQLDLVPINMSPAVAAMVNSIHR